MSTRLVVLLLLAVATAITIVTADNMCMDSENARPPEVICDRVAATCDWRSNFACHDKITGQWKCFDEHQAKDKAHLCDACFNLRKCAVQKCVEECPQNWCATAFARSYECPQPMGNPGLTYMAFSGAFEGQCGLNEPGNIYSLVDNMGVTGCCNFQKSCTVKKCNSTCNSMQCRRFENIPVQCEDGFPFVATKTFSNQIFCGVNESCAAGVPSCLLSNPDVQECCDQRSCEVQKCSEQCSTEFCQLAASNNWRCGGELPYMVSDSRRIQGACGRNVECDDKWQCWVNNIDVQGCCRQSSCTKPKTCKQQCPDFVCKWTTPQGNFCPSRAPYMCLAGQSDGGCNSNDTYWLDPQAGCDNCCDYRTCYKSCDICPPGAPGCGMCASQGNNFMCNKSYGNMPPYEACAPSPLPWEQSGLCWSCCQCQEQQQQQSKRRN